MVSITALLATSTAFFASASALEVGEYFRPTPDVVSGIPNKDAPYRRSPCPALNTLANHGYINRDGQNLTKIQLHTAVIERLNVAVAIADNLVARLPDTLDLNLLGTHNFIEHDGSMVHADAYYGADPSHVDDGLLQDILGRANPVLDVNTFGAIRRDRARACLEKNPDCTYTNVQDGGASRASASIILAFGNPKDQTISRENFDSVLGHERLPVGFTKPEEVTVEAFGALAAKILAAEHADPSAPVVPTSSPAPTTPVPTTSSPTTSSPSTTTPDKPGC